MLTPVTDFLIGFFALVAVFALSMGGFSRATEKKNEIWLGALKLAIGAFAIAFIFLT